MNMHHVCHGNSHVASLIHVPSPRGILSGSTHREKKKRSLFQQLSTVSDSRTGKGVVDFSRTCTLSVSHFGESAEEVIVYISKQLLICLSRFIYSLNKRLQVVLKYRYYRQPHWTFRFKNHARGSTKSFVRHTYLCRDRHQNSESSSLPLRRSQHYSEQKEDRKKL